MKAFIQKLVSDADLSEAQAEKVAEVLRGFLGERLPDMVREPVMSAQSGKAARAPARPSRRASASSTGS